MGGVAVNKLFYGDNLWVLRESVRDESVDLIYLDPPFNSQATYNILFQTPAGEASEAQAAAFHDTWHWTDQTETTFDALMAGGTAVARILAALREFMGSSDMMAYLVNMAIRFNELWRVLKPTGNIFLHCDSTASHYLKILLDGVFGAENFRNEIIWRRTGANNSANRFGPIHQNILFYGKSADSTFNKTFGRYTKDYIRSYFTYEDDRGLYQAVSLTGPGIRSGESGRAWRGSNPTASGRHWQPASYVYAKYKELTGKELAPFPLLERLDKLDAAGLIHWGKKAGGQPRYKYYAADAPGVPHQDIWACQPGTEGCVLDKPNECVDEDVRWLTANSRERLGYPTQKPLGLLRRIIMAGSNEGDLVLDPFCGCGTTIHAAHELHRKWIGIDITHYAVTIIEDRLKAQFAESDIGVEGRPITMDGARELARRDKYQFQWWANWLLGVQNYRERKKGADSGIDGMIYFKNGPLGIGRIIVSVKGGDSIAPDMVRALAGTVDREKANLGVLMTLAKPSRTMIAEAAACGFVNTAQGKYPKVQIVTVEELLEKKKINMPQRYEFELDERTAQRAGTREQHPQRELTYVFEGGKDETGMLYPAEHTVARRFKIG